jgi:phage repressor protein C with HTH and peptisase S24 domain
MLTHQQIWMAIDALAANNGMSASGLARRAGLDATTFNKSKRVSPVGRLRWPSTESVSKVLEVTGTSMDDFLNLLRSQGGARKQKVPLIGFAQAGAGGFFSDAGFPAGAGWDEVEVPSFGSDHSYALEISGDSMLPVYRDGDRIVVNPDAPVRRGDRVVVKTKAGEVLAKELRRQTGKTIELRSLNAAHEDRSFAADEVEWMARIMWTSQ